MAVPARGARAASTPKPIKVTHQPALPVALAAAGFTISGIVIAASNLPFWLTLWGLLRIPFEGRRAVWFCVLLAPLGFIRFDMWQQLENPLTDYFGETAQVTGVSDGRYLTVETPQELRGVRVAVSPQGVVDAGRVDVAGVWLEPTEKRNPGGFDYQAFLRRRRVMGQLLVREVIDQQPARGLARVKVRLARGVTVGLTEEAAGLMQAMTLGIRSDLGDLRDSFAAAGLAHILALSGLHVSILIGAVSWLLRPLARWRYPLLIALLLGFVALVGLSPSIVRAGLMGTALLLSLWLGAGRIDTWQAFGIALTLTLVAFPAWLLDLSLQLSYLAVAGILLLATPILRHIVGEDLGAKSKKQPVTLDPRTWSLKTVVYGSVSVSIAAQVLAVPLLLHHFGQLPLMSPFVNVIAIPLATVLVPLGFAAGVLGLVWLPLARAINFITLGVAQFLIFLAESAERLPQLYWGEILPIGFIYYAVGVIGLALALRGQLRWWRGLLLMSVAMVCSMVTLPTQRAPEIVYLDVGQGDSVLIRLPGRTEILVDGGGSPFSDFDVGKNTVVPALRALGVDELEVMIASHADTDHIEGLPSVLAEIPTQQLIVGADASGDPLYDRLLRAARYRGVDVQRVRRGESMRLGRARLEFLHPSVQLEDNDNDNSVVFVLHYDGQARALFLGDASIDIERQLAFPDIDVVMAGHHGSSHSTSAALLQATTPDIAVISYGRNTYGHPHPSVLRRLEAVNASIFETYRHGAVRVSLAQDYVTPTVKP